MVWEVRTEENIELFQSLMFSWGRCLPFLSQCIRLHVQDPTETSDAEHTVLDVFILPHPAQRSRAGSCQPQGTHSVPPPPPPQRKEQPRVGLYLPPHSDAPAPLSHPAVYTRHATALPTLQMEGPKWAIAHSFFQIFLKVRSFLQLVIS